MADTGKGSQPSGGGTGLVDPANIVAWATDVHTLSTQWIGENAGMRGNHYLWSNGQPSGVDGKGVTVLGDGTVANIEAQAAGELKLLRAIVIYQERSAGANVVQVRLRNVTKSATIYQRNITSAGSAAAWAIDIQTGALAEPLASHSFDIDDIIALQVYATSEKAWNVSALFVGVYLV